MGKIFAAWWAAAGNLTMSGKCPCRVSTVWTDLSVIEAQRRTACRAFKDTGTGFWFYVKWGRKLQSFQLQKKKIVSSNTVTKRQKKRRKRPYPSRRQFPGVWKMSLRCFQSLFLQYSVLAPICDMCPRFCFYNRRWFNLRHLRGSFYSAVDDSWRRPVTFRFSP